MVSDKLFLGIRKGCLAETSIMLVFLLWGMNYNITKFCLRYLSPLVECSLSFGSGAVVLLCILHRKIRWKDLMPSFIVGFFICVSSVFQLYALQRTLVAKTAFYATLDIPVTALIEYFFRKLDLNEIIGAFCSLIGALLLSWNGQSISPNNGDWFSIIGCIPSSLYFISCSYYVSSESKESLVIGQLVTTSVIAAILCPILETPMFIFDWYLILGLSISGCLSCGLALYILTWAQMHTTPTRTVIIGAPEPVFAAIVAYIVYGERFHSYLNILGAVLMIIGE